MVGNGGPSFAFTIPKNCLQPHSLLHPLGLAGEALPNCSYLRILLGNSTSKEDSEKLLREVLTETLVFLEAPRNEAMRNQERVTLSFVSQLEGGQWQAADSCFTLA